MARRGIAGDGNREIQLGGEGNLEKECRANIETRQEVKQKLKRGREKGLLRTIRCFSALPLTSGVFFGDGFSSGSEDKRSLRPVLGLRRFLHSVVYWRGLHLIRQRGEMI